MMGMRWVLQSINDRQTATPAPALLPVSTTGGPLELLWPVLVVLAGLLAAVLALRRIGWRRSLPLLGAAWLVLWLAGSAALLQRHFNREGLFFQPGAGLSAAAPPVTARVVASQFKQPSLRSLGGTELVLQVSRLDIPQRLVLNDPRAALLKPGDALALQVMPGRFSGLFVTGWAPAPAASAPAPLSSAPAVLRPPAPAASH